MRPSHQVSSKSDQNYQTLLLGWFRGGFNVPPAKPYADILLFTLNYTYPPNFIQSGSNLLKFLIRVVSGWLGLVKIRSDRSFLVESLQKWLPCKISLTSDQNCRSWPFAPISGGGWGGPIYIFEVNLSCRVIWKHHTKFQPSSSKRLEINPRL